jgi:hypothetical protein
LKKIGISGCTGHTGEILMDGKDKEALRKVTDTRPPDFLQDAKENNGREA